MEDIIKNPLQYFQNLLESDKFNELKKTYISELIENNGSVIENIDNENGIITYWDFFYDQATDSEVEGLVTFDFNKSFNSKINTEYFNSKNTIDNIVLSITVNGFNPKEFIDIQIHLLKDLYLKTDSYYTNKPIVKNAVVALINFIQDKYLKEKIIFINPNSPNIIDIENYSEFSFNWDSLNQEEKIQNIEKLYILLTETPALIESSKEEFINAFTMRELSTGIKWLVTHNNLISKSSLFYFVNKLIEEGCIVEVPSAQLNKKVDYLFRDSFGKKLKNIRQSKATSTSNPAQKDRIDSILESLFS